MRNRTRANSTAGLAVALLVTSCTSVTTAAARTVSTSATLAASAQAVSSATPTEPAPANPAHDGLIVFTDFPLADPSKPKQLYLERADGTHLRHLLHSNTDDVTATISPDGHSIVFTRQRDHGNLPDQIFEVGVNGRGLHQILPGGCPVATCGDAVEGHAYSPDGRRLVFTRAVFPDGPDAPPTVVELWTCNRDGSHARRLTEEHGLAQDDEASWSPNGRRIVYLHWVYGSPDRFRIATIAVDGTSMHIVTPRRLDTADPSYSPQGDLIVFQSPPDPQDGPQVLYTVRPDGTHLKRLSASRGTAANHPSWSPDGRRLLFCYIPLGQLHGADLAIIKRDGTGMHILKQTPLNENGAYWGTGPANS